MTTAAAMLGSIRAQPRRWLIVPIVMTIAPALVLLKSAIADWDAVPLISSQRVGVELIYQVAALGLVQHPASEVPAGQPGHLPKERVAIWSSSNDRPRPLIKPDGRDDAT